VPNLGFGLKLTVVKEQCPDTPAYVWVARRLPPRGLENEMRRVLSEQLPKLIDTPSNERVLLLENRSLGSNHHAVANAIEAISSDYPELQKLDAAWLVTTTFSRPYFRRVWPGGLGEKFIDP
jgi:hypothetical protein